MKIKSVLPLLLSLFFFSPTLFAMEEEQELDQFPLSIDQELEAILTQENGIMLKDPSLHIPISSSLYSSPEISPPTPSFIPQENNQEEDISIHFHHYNFQEDGKSYITSSNPQEPKIINGVKPRHVCNECGKLFFHSGDLSRHRSTIHKGQRYLCEICGKSFTQNGHRMAHQLVHANKTVPANKESFACGYCKRSFKRVSDRTRHQLAIHDRYSNHKQAIIAATKKAKLNPPHTDNSGERSEG